MKKYSSILLITLITLLGCNQKRETKQVEEVKEEPRAFNMIYVEGGEFTMGSSEIEDNLPHQVILSDFYMSDIEVTQSLYEEIMEENYVIKYDKGINKPVYYVSWYSAVEFCNRLSIRDNYVPCYEINGEDVKCNFNTNGYRLPTEAEWEYAARGGKLTKGYTFSGSDNIDDVAFWAGNYNGQIMPSIALKSPNELGIFDMTISVKEWCWNWSSNEGSVDLQKKNPRGPTKGNEKIARGSSQNSFFLPTYNLASRTNLKPDLQYSQIGFRICRSKVDK